MLDANLTSPRRRFLAQLAAAAATLGSMPLAARAHSSTSDDSLRDADAWMKPLRGKHRAIFHATSANETPMLMARNFLDAYRDAFGAREGEVNAVIGIHSGALAMGLGDDIWRKYELGKSGNITDITTKAPALRNTFARDGDLAIEAMQKRGIVFLMCNTALRMRSQGLAKSLNVPYEDVYGELSRGRLPGVILVPALVVALARAQERGFGYIRAN